MAKTAKFSPVCWELTCPACNKTLPSPYNGSEFWTLDDLRSSRLVRTHHTATGKTTAGTTCQCGQWVNMPDRLMALAQAE